MTMPMMFSSAFVQDLFDAMSELQGTMVDVLAVVASFGPWDRQQYRTTILWRMHTITW
jgi:hypothetical protein